MTAPSTHGPTSGGALGVRLLLLGVVGAGFGYLAAVFSFFTLWAVGIAQEDGSSRDSTLVIGGYALAVLVVLAGFVLVGRALAGRAWWFALPSLALGPLALAAQVGLL